MSIQVTSINGQPYINGKPVYYGETRGRNILINGEVTRINQRGFDGTSWIDGEYAYDRWKATASEMTQIVEDTNYKYDTEYTLSGDGITTSQITSPSSGDWTIPDVPRTARNIQLEEGSVATPFEVVPIADTLSRCQRYYEVRDKNVLMFPWDSGTQIVRGHAEYKVTKRKIPDIVATKLSGESTMAPKEITIDGFKWAGTGDAGTLAEYSYTADAEL